MVYASKTTAHSPAGELALPLCAHKLLSENSSRYNDAAIIDTKIVLGDRRQRIPERRSGDWRHVAANALLKRKGERVPLVVNRGFVDVFKIANETRPCLFDIEIKLFSMLCEEVVEISDRVGIDGLEIETLDEAAQRALVGAAEGGFRTCAIVLIHTGNVRPPSSG